MNKCLECIHLTKSSRAYPCVSCIHVATNQFKPERYITVSELIKQLQSITNQQTKIPLHQEVGTLLSKKSTY